MTTRFSPPRHGRTERAKNSAFSGVLLLVLVVIGLAVVAAEPLGPYSSGPGAPRSVAHPSSVSPTAVSPAAHPSLAGGYTVTVVPVGLNSTEGYSFLFGGLARSGNGTTNTTITGLPPGLYSITNVNAYPADPGWQFFGRTDRDNPIVVPTELTVELIFAYVNLSASPSNVTFQEDKVPTGTGWQLIFNGTGHSSATSLINVTARPGFYVWNAALVTSSRGTIEYVPPAPSGATYVAANSTVPISYSVYYALQVFASSGGTVIPAGLTWHPANSTGYIRAIGTTNTSFLGWSGTGPGSTNAPTPRVQIRFLGPITESGTFIPAGQSRNTLRFNEIGLPNQTVWSIYLNGVPYSSVGTDLPVSNLHNCTTNVTGDPGRYSLYVPYAYVNTSFPASSVRYTPGPYPAVICGNDSITPLLQFSPENYVTIQSTDGGTAAASTSDGATIPGYVSPSDTITLTATAAPTAQFVGWVGTGSGSYTGPNAVQTIHATGPITEAAEFSPAGPPPTTTVFLRFSATTVLAPGTVWSVIVDGKARAAYGSLLNVTGLLPGTHTAQILNATGPDGLEQYVPVNSTVSVNLTIGSTILVAFITYYWVNVTAVGPGSTTPASGWVLSGSTLGLSQTASSGSSFEGWAGTGGGAYSGSLAGPSVKVAGPISEVASFASVPPEATDAWHSPVLLVGIAAAAVLVGFLLGVYLLSIPRRPRPPSATGVPEASSRPGPAAPTDWREDPPPSQSMEAALVSLLVVSSSIGFWAAETNPSPGVFSQRATLVPGGHGSGPISADLLSPAAHPAIATLHGARSAAPLASGGNLTFIESGLPPSTTWSASVWNYTDGGSAPVTTSGTSSQLVVPVATSWTATDFELWVVPSSTPGSVWLGTPDVVPPVDASQSSVNVSFALVSLTGVAFRLHLTEVGLPAETNWTTQINGAGYAFEGSTNTWIVKGGSQFVLNASPIILPNGTAYFPTAYDVLPLYGAYGWQNVTGVPLVLNDSGPSCVTVRYAMEDRLTVTTGTGGGASVVSGWVTPNVPVTITAAPLANYGFLNWTGTGLGSVSSTSLAITLTPEGPVSEFAAFQATPYTITVTAVGIPSGEPFVVFFSNGPYSSSNGTIIIPGVTTGSRNFTTPYAYPNASVGERFVPTSVSSTFTQTAGSTFAIDGNGSFTVTYQTQYSLSVASSGPGYVTPGNGSYWEPAGAQVAIVATPLSGAGLQNWTGVGAGASSGTEVGILVTMNGPIRETARFGPPLAAPAFHLLLNETGLPGGSRWSAAAGVIGASSTGTSLDIDGLTGVPATVSIPALYLSADHRFVPTYQNGSFSVTLESNTSLTIPFQEQFAVHAIASIGGSVLPYVSWAPVGSTVVLLPGAALSGYHFSGWHGSVNSTASKLSVTVTAAVAESAQFDPNGTSAATSGPKDAVIAAGTIVPAVVGGLLLSWVMLRLFRRKRT